MQPCRTWIARAAAGILALAVASTGQSHEFWMLPQSFALAVGSPVTLSLSVGENFVGDRVGITRSLVSRLDLYARGSRTQLTSAVPSNEVVGELNLPQAKPGTHLFALDTHPTVVVLPAQKFNDYLREEGLDAVIRARELSGSSGRPGRERYRRNIKTLVLAGTASDATYAMKTGQRLEIVPQTDPFTLRPGAHLELLVLFDGRPLADSLVKLWQRPGQPAAATQRTNKRGMVRFTVPEGGTWMASVVHMLAVRGSTELDWDSYWGNLTFSAGPPNR